jgi:hypothetical protein
MPWQAIGFYFSIVVTAFNGLIFVLVKFNDLKHLDENMKLVLGKMGELSERLSRMEGICSVCAKKARINHKR